MLVSMTNKNNFHYYVTTVDLRTNTITFRESMGNDLNPHQFALARCIATGIELLRLNLNVYGSSCREDWRVLQSCNVTKQNDAISCGVIAIIYSLMIFSGQENKYQIPFEKLDLISVRKLIVKILGDGILPRLGCEITPIRADRYGFTAVYKDRICSCLRPIEGADGSSSFTTHPHVTVCEFVTLAGKKCLGLASKEPYLCSHCHGHNQHRKANICKHCDNDYIPLDPMAAPAGLTSVIDIFSGFSGTVIIREAHEEQKPPIHARKGNFYLPVNPFNSAIPIWLPVQYLRLSVETGPEQKVSTEEGAAVGSERSSSKRISDINSAASPHGKRYVNFDFKPGGICDPEPDKNPVVKRIRILVKIEEEETKQLILQTPQILGDRVLIANKRQQVVGIVNDASSTCWFNVLIQSFCWNDDVALAAWTYLTTNAVSKLEVNIN